MRLIQNPLRLALVLGSFLAAMGAAALEPSPQSPPRYETRVQHDTDGIGKFYLTREIAHVMGHEGAYWLERPERDQEEKPQILLQSLELKPGQSVADIGAGTGYFSWRLAQGVGPGGKVLAVEIQKEMLELLQKNMAEKKFTNVVSILGTVDNPNLPPQSVDLVLMVDVYHEFSHPYEMLSAICRALKPGGRIAFVEYRAEDPKVPIKRLHKMSEEQVRREATLHPLVWEKTVTNLPRQHIILFRKKDSQN